MQQPASGQSQQLSRLLSYLLEDPKNTYLLGDALRLAVETGDAAVIQQLITHTTTYDIEDGIVFALLTHASLIIKNYPLAVQFGLAAVDVGTADWAVLTNTALAYLYARQYEDADQFLSSRISPEDDIPDFLVVVYARVLHHLDQSVLAIRLIERVVKQGTNHPEIFGLLALLYAEDDLHHQAQKSAQHALSLDSKQTDALLALAESHLSQHQLADASEYFQQLLSINPQSGRGWSGLGTIAFYQSQFEQAEQLLLKSIDYMNNHIGTWHLLGWIHINSRNLDAARHAMDQAYALDRNFAETHGGLAVIDALEGRTDTAERSIQRALRLNPHCLPARYAKILLLDAQKDSIQISQIMADIMQQPAPTHMQSSGLLVDEWLKLYRVPNLKHAQAIDQDTDRQE